MAATGKSRRPPQRRPSDLEIHAEIERTRLKTIGFTIIGSIFAVAVMLLAAVPLAHEIAGKKTDFEVNLTLSLTITFTITTAVASGFAVTYRKINQRLRRRNGELEDELDKSQRNVTRLEGEIADAHGRLQDLEEAAGA